MSGTAALTLEALPGERVDELAATLHDARLPSSDLAGSDKRFFCAHVGSTAVGYVGLEIHGEDALLRSAVIFKHARGQGWGRQMVEGLMEIAFDVGVERVWLLTETAAGFFAKVGFHPVDRLVAPPEIATSEEFTRLCPSRATLMLRRF
jgi:amino-acid N-acetyltransferase